jgi:hypothetical protein
VGERQLPRETAAGYLIDARPCSLRLGASAPIPIVQSHLEVVMLSAGPAAPARLARAVRVGAAAVCVIAAVAACGDDDDDNDLTGPGQEVPRGASIFGVDDRNTLVVFGRQNPTNEAARRVPITGLQVGDTIIGIDFRANATAIADRRLYAVTKSSFIYTVDTTSGAATRVGTTAFTPAAAGTAFGIDFNPVADRLRLHSDQEQDLRINQLTGAVAATDTVLAYMPGDANVGQNPNVAGTAYTNTVPGATVTDLFAIDSDRDALVFLATPNSGRLRTVGALGVNTTASVGFDIAGAGAGVTAGAAYATLTLEGESRSKLYTINLASGLATLVGDVNYTRPLVGVSAAP